MAAEQPHMSNLSVAIMHDMRLVCSLWQLGKAALHGQVRLACVNDSHERVQKHRAQSWNEEGENPGIKVVDEGAADRAGQGSEEASW